MLEKLMQRNKGSLIATLLLLVAVLASVQLVFLTYSQNLNLHKRYLSSVQSAMDLETARDLCLWEIRQAGGSWDTNTSTPIDSTCRFPGATIDTYGFYSIPGYNFRAKVKNEGTVSIYIHAFQGSAPNYKYSKYAEYTYTPIPLYQYFKFSNVDLVFAGKGQYECRGGRIHSNKNIVFMPYYAHDFNPGLAFNQTREFTANGTIQYAQRYGFAIPFLVDTLDAYDENGNGWIDTPETTNATLPPRGGMAPAPYPVPGGNHYNTTDNKEVFPGPLRNYYFSAYFNKLDFVSSNINGTWAYPDDSISNAPEIWRGEDSAFYGRQYNVISNYDYYFDENATSNLIAGNIVYNFTLSSDNSTLVVANSTSGGFHQANIVFKPYQYSDGSLNNITWLELPGALPEGYSWQKYGSWLSGVPVKFYATEQCIGNTTAGCMIEAPEPRNTTGKGWRYIKKKPDGAYCSNANNTCYNDPTSNYVPAEEYNITVNSVSHPYFYYIKTLDGDRNEQFFGDNFTYGNDMNFPDSPYRIIRAFNSARQPNGFQNYLTKLAQLGFTNVMKSGVYREFNVGQLFDSDSPHKDSAYKSRAMQNGIYITDGSAWLYSQGNPVENLFSTSVANSKTFYNWRTTQQVRLIDINIAALRARQSSWQTSGYNFNGIIYSKFPVRLSSATELPGTNDANRKAVFTVICEESIYLKGDYNTVNWKIAHLVTKKIIYVLSSGFDDPQVIPDYRVYDKYPNVYDAYPYVYLHKNVTTGTCDALEIDPTNPPTPINGSWIYAYSAFSAKINQPCTMNDTLADYAYNRQVAKQSAWVSGHNNPFPHTVPNMNNVIQNISAVFITPFTFSNSYSYRYDNTSSNAFNFNTELEKWDQYYCWAPGNCRWYYSTLNAIGSFIYIYDPSNPNWDDEYYTPLNATEDPFITRHNIAPVMPANSAPDNNYADFINIPGQLNTDKSTIAHPTITQVYDDRLPTAVPKNYEAVLGLTGGEALFRQVSQEYFNLSTQ